MAGMLYEPDDVSNDDADRSKMSQKCGPVDCAAQGFWIGWLCSEHPNFCRSQCRLHSFSSSFSLH